jgi:hypothetical protein
MMTELIDNGLLGLQQPQDSEASHETADVTIDSNMSGRRAP